MRPCPSWTRIGSPMESKVYSHWRRTVATCSNKRTFSSVIPSRLAIFTRYESSPGAKRLFLAVPIARMPKAPFFPGSPRVTRDFNPASSNRFCAAGSHSSCDSRNWHSSFKTRWATEFGTGSAQSSESMFHIMDLSFCDCTNARIPSLRAP